MKHEKCVIFSAPSGAGKTTIVRSLLNLGLPLEFSVSACSRPARGHETDGKDYYFLTPENFLHRVKEDEFLEWEEVYKGYFYGTLKIEIERLWKKDKVIVFDVDVKGAEKLKNYFRKKALAIFIKPPSMQVLRERLMSRDTESLESLQARLKRSGMELRYEDKFDAVIVNDHLQRAVQEAEGQVARFLEQ